VLSVYAGGAGLEVEGWAAAAFGWLVAGFVMLCSPFAFGLVALASLIGIAVSGLIYFSYSLSSLLSSHAIPK
jgi:hypothetical protein